MAFDNLGFDAPFVLQDGPVRSLHFTFGEIQSSMHVDRPDALQVDYTRTMMGFLLIQPDPRRIAMIGLGGGSLAKFCHRHLGASRITVVENNPHVIALRKEFAIPDDGPRLTVLLNDGAAYVRQAAGIDALLVDAFDGQGQPRGLCAQDFYDDCHRALAPGGVMAVNVHVDDADYPLLTRRIAASFRGNAMQVIAHEKHNCIIFAARGPAVTLEALRSPGWSRALAAPARQQLQADIDHIGWNACALRAGPP